MWTLCWTGAEIENGWERWETREDIITRTNTLVLECDVCEDDILIFPPQANKLIIPYGEIEDKKENEVIPAEAGQKTKCIDCPRQPMKPKTDDLDDQDMILCPACGYELMGADQGDYFGYPKYCSDCGQMLNWKEDTDIKPISISEFERFRAHIGHEIGVVIYGDQNVAVECIDCNTVLYSIDNPEYEENH